MESKKLIKESADYRFYIRQLLIPTAIIVFLTLMILAITFKTYIQISLIVFCSSVLLFSPLYFYNTFRLIKIFRRPQNYIYQETSFNESHSIGFSNRLYFTLKVKNKENMEIKIDTKSIFSTSIFATPTFEEYNNKIVLVGYNEKTEEIITIKVVN